MFEIYSVSHAGKYMFCRTIPKHPNANSNGYYSHHRAVMENHLGRLLNRNEEVRHINKNKKDNRIENLILVESQTHPKGFIGRSSKFVDLTCKQCGKIYPLKEHIARGRTKVYKTNFCSQTCSARYLTKKKESLENGSNSVSL